jgi:dTDP-4-dehydrorhamnose 3,5-epimerase-like enzyme
MNKEPKILKGKSHSDARGTLVFNNDYNAVEVKRIYFIENKDTSFIRGWQGHQIEQRWFSSVQGSFKITTMPIKDWENLIEIDGEERFILNASSFDVLHVPNGYVTSIQALEEKSRLMALSDYGLGEIQDEYRFPIDSFLSVTKK